MRTLLRLTLALSLGPLALGCADLLGNGSDAGAEGGASAATSAEGGTVTAQGADCITESTTGATLCTAISICPNVAVDHDTYPNCGFRIRGQAIDVECACSGALCPLGTPTTCDQVTQLLGSQTEQQVCTQISEGRCTAGTPAPAPSGTAATSTCDRACANDCAGDVGCVKLCGC